MAHQNYDIRRVLPAEFQNGGYGNYEAVQSLSSAAAAAIDQNILQHENPNRCGDDVLAPRLSLDQYRLNIDQSPHVIRRKPQEKVQYCQEIAVRYLKPPPPPKNGDIIIRELPSKQVAPAPPLIVRQPGPKAPTPPPVCIRECPPQPPQPLQGKTITVPGKTVPPPARKVIVERLPPVPPKPQQVFVERWLPYGPQTQRVVYERSKAICHIPDPKNVVIQWEAPDVEVRREVRNLGVQPADPQDYVRRHGSKLVRADQLPEVAVKYAQPPQGVQLAAGAQQQHGVNLEGDVQALGLIDLDANGLGYLRGRFSQSTSNLASASYSAQGGAGSVASGGGQFEDHNGGHLHIQAPQFLDDQNLGNNAYASAAYSNAGSAGGAGPAAAGSAVYASHPSVQGHGSAVYANQAGGSAAYASEHFSSSSSPEFHVNNAVAAAAAGSEHAYTAAGSQHFEASSGGSASYLANCDEQPQQQSFQDFPC